MAVLASVVAMRRDVYSDRICGPRRRLPSESSAMGVQPEIYGLEGDSMMVTHIDGDGLWDLLIDAARAADWAVMPVGFPPLVFSQGVLDALPEGLGQDAVITSSRDELREMILAG